MDCTRAREKRATTRASREVVFASGAAVAGPVHGVKQHVPLQQERARYA